MEMSHHGFFLSFQNKNTSASEYIFLLTHFFYYIDIHMEHEREKCSPLRSYISRAVNDKAELNVNGNGVNEGTQ